MISPKRVLVTGGAGFIGSALCRYLVGKLGLQVLNVDKLTYAGNLRSLRDIEANPNYRFLKADICDRAAMDEALRGFRPDAVMHLAAETHVDRSITGASAFIETNIIGTYTLLEASLTYWSEQFDRDPERFRFLNVSTDEVYGSLGAEGLFSETTAYDPSSPYSAAKASADHLTNAWAETFDLPALISNCSNNYGGYQHPEKLIPTMILNALDGHALPVYGDGSNVRDWLYVDDHARALWDIVTKGRIGEKYNVGGRNERTNLEVVEAICSLLDDRRPKAQGQYKDQIRFVEDRPGHDARYAIDATKTENELGWKADEDFESGIALTVDWYLSNEWWWGDMRLLAQQRRGLITS